MIRELILFRPFFSLLLPLSFSPFCTYEPTFRIHSREAIPTISKTRIVVVATNTRIKAYTVDNLLGIQSFALRIGAHPHSYFSLIPCNCDSKYSSRCLQFIMATDD